MDPFVVFDCQQVVPNRFSLALAAAARSRALLRGERPRLTRSGEKATEVSLQEIAGRAFSREELAPFLRLGGARPRSASSATAPVRRGAIASVSPRGKRQVMMQLIQQEKDHGETTVSQ